MSVAPRMSLALAELCYFFPPDFYCFQREINGDFGAGGGLHGAAAPTSTLGYINIKHQNMRDYSKKLSSAPLSAQPIKGILYMLIVSTWLLQSNKSCCCLREGGTLSAEKARCIAIPTHIHIPI